MSAPIERGRKLDRRSLLLGVGGVSLAGLGAGALVARGEVASHAAEEIPWVAATTATDPAGRTMDVVLLDADRKMQLERVELSPHATVVGKEADASELSAHEQILLAADERPDGTLVAHEVIRAVFGDPADAQSRSL